MAVNIHLNPENPVSPSRQSRSSADLLPISPSVRKTPHPGKPWSFFLIFGPVKNRQVNHLAIQGQGKAGDLPGVQIKFFQFEKILWGNRARFL
jgi:hypothetical protein